MTYVAPSVVDAPAAPSSDTIVSLEDWRRFWGKVRVGDDCWEWQTGKFEWGYGAFRLGGRGTGRLRKAHRVAYEWLVGPIPEGLTLDHLCRNPPCVNPAHLEPVTMRVNTLRGMAPSAINAKLTHCRRGHPFDEANTYHHDGQRLCRPCRNEASRRWRASGGGR